MKIQHEAVPSVRFQNSNGELLFYTLRFNRTVWSIAPSGHAHLSDHTPSQR